MIVAAALGLLLGQGPGGLVFPQAAVQAPAPDYVSWPGFGYLPADGRTVKPTFAAPGDWSNVQNAPNAIDTAATWRLRIFVLKRIDRTVKLANGSVYEERASLETPDLERIQRAAGLLGKMVEAETGGSLKLSVQLTVEPDSILAGGRTLDQTLEDYVFPRANGGKYVAEDKVKRGPYESIMVFHPSRANGNGELEVNGMPVSAIPVYGFDGYEAEGVLAIRMANAWHDSLHQIARRSGVLGRLESVPAVSAVTGLSNPLAYVPDGGWASIFQGQDLPGPDIDARLKLKYPDDRTVGVPLKLLGQSFKGSTCQAEMATDPAKGAVLSYSERGEARNGGLDFPSAPTAEGSIVPAKTPTLTFWCKSNSQDPLALELVSDQGKNFDICLGQDVPGATDVYRANFLRDGTWRQLKVDLKQSGFDSISQIRLVPSPNALHFPKITLGPIEYSFASFAVGGDAADPALPENPPASDSTDPFARAAWAATATPSPKLLALLKDPEWFVRLNAIGRYIDQPDPSAEPALTENANLAIDGPVAAAALRALWKLGTPAAKALVHQTIKTGVTEQGKAQAALLLGESKDTTFAPELILLSQSRGLETREAVIEALSEMPGESATLIRMSLLLQEDPELNLKITQTSDPDDAYQWKKLLWSSVNEGSDAVRLTSYEKLTQSNDPSARAGGFSGVKDDSIEVRIQLLRFLEAHPNENNRDALRQAIADRSARVRAAALRGFAVLPKPDKPDELGAVFQDVHPVVQLAAIDYAKKKGVALPEDAATRLSASADPEVRAAYKELKP